MTRFWRYLTVLVAFVVCAGLVTVAAQAHDAKLEMTYTKTSGTTGFLVRCGHSHSHTDDPIVYPGQPGASHNHDFHGATTTDAYSTLGSLKAGGTNCSTHNDHAAYWFPHLIEGGVTKNPVGNSIYYQVKVNDEDSVGSPPQGLKMIAGNALATATSKQPASVTGFQCGNSAESASPPSCPGGELNNGADGLQLVLRFPDCWNGTTLDSADHKSHMKYSANGVCPSSHPVALPRIQVFVRYASNGGPDVSLSSGSIYSFHGDFFNAWNPQALAVLVDDCIHRNVKCSEVRDA